MKNSSVSFAASFIEGVQRSRGGVFLLVSLFLNPPLTTSYLSFITALRHLRNSNITPTHHIHTSVFILCTCSVHAMFMAIGKDSLTIANHQTILQFTSPFTTSWILG